MLKKSEETTLKQGIPQLVSSSESFAFLRDEEDLYTVEDLKKRLTSLKIKEIISILNSKRAQ